MPHEPEQREIDDFAFHLFNITRGVGMEQGSELLLQLLFLRWAAHEPELDQDHRTLWAVMCNDVRRGVVRPGPMVQRALEERLGPGAGDGVLVGDDGRTIDLLLDQIDAWPFATPDRESIRKVASRLFESVLRLRSERLSRAGGESETPTSLAELMARAIVEPGMRVIDPACGIGTSLLIAARSEPDRLVGRDINVGSAFQARMRLQLAAVNADIERADSLYGWKATGRYDAVLLQPPFGQKPSDDVSEYLSSTLRFGAPGRTSTDFTWLQIAHRLMAPAGRAAVLSPAGTLFRDGVGGAIRHAMLEAGAVEAVIALPPRMLAGTTVASALWLLRNGPADRDPGVLLVNAEAVEHTRGRSRVELTEAGIEEIVDVLRRWRRSPDEFSAPRHLARPLSLGELDDARNLAPARYLDLVPDETPPRPAPPRRLLSELRLTNLKSFGDQQRVELAPITVIYGPNSAGKSSILQSLLLLKQSLAANTLVTQGELTDAGSFAGLVHRHETERRVGLGLTYGTLDRWDVPDGVPDPSLMRSVDFAFGTEGADLPEQHHVRFGFGGLRVTFPRSVHGRSDHGALPFALPVEDLDPVFAAIAEGTILFPFDSRRVQDGDDRDEERRRRSRQSNARRARRLLDQAGLRELAVASNGLLPTASVDLEPIKPFFAGKATGQDEGVVASYVKRSAQLAAGTGEELRRLLDELTYLGPLRSAPQRYYNRATAAAGAGTAGEHIALHLFDSRSEVDEVNTWLGALGLPYTLKVVPVRTMGGTAIIGDNVAIVLTDTRSGIEVSPADVGFGVSQVLPIVVQLLAKQESVICVEQPEIHIHPKLQTELADLLIYSASESGRANQLIVETHSEHLLLRLQRRIREKTLSADDVSVLYVEPDERGQARVRRLRIDSQGFFVDPWPAGFFDESLDELFGGAP